MSLVERRPSRSLSSSGHTCKSHAPLVSRFPVSIQILPCGTGFWAIWNAAEISHFRKLLHLSMPWQREGIYHPGNVKLTPLASAPSFERTVISPLLCLCSSEPGSPAVSGQHLEGETVVSTGQLLPRPSVDWILPRVDELCSAPWQTISKPLKEVPCLHKGGQKWHTAQYKMETLCFNFKMIPIFTSSDKTYMKQLKGY